MQIFDYGLLLSIQPWKVNTTKRKDFLELKMENVFPVLNTLRIKLWNIWLYLCIYLFDTDMFFF